MVGESQEKMSAYYLLVAGLFLVVAATICRAETCRLTMPLLASLLFELVLVQRAIASDASVDTIPSSPTECQHHFRPRHHGRLGEWAPGLPVCSQT
ncbi:hypothetical protein EDD85DRAFT_136528 [Armillaria nabsnona]|nr:hypothetical protein EDD85DRAFT_136528 [Armillaria nabsnona]